MVAGQQDVVVADGVGEEIGGVAGIVEGHERLGAAQVGLVAAGNQLALRHVMTREVAADLE